MTNSTNDIRFLFADALRKHQAGQLSAAEKLYRRVLGVQPLHRDSLHLLGAIRLSEKKPQEAITLIKKALELGDDVAPICFNLARAYEDNSQFDLALEFYQRALKLTPKDFEIHLGMGNVHMASGNYASALATYENMLLAVPRNAQALNNKGIALKNLGQLDAALVAFEAAVQSKPDHLDAHYNRATLLEARMYYEDALQSYDQILSIDARHVVTLQARGKLYSKQKKHPEAIVDFGKAFLLQPRSMDIMLDLVSERCKICDWKDLEENVQVLQKAASPGMSTYQPLTISRLIDSPELMLKTAQYFSKQYCTTIRQHFDAKPVAARKIRIGYLSSDLHEKHPVYQALLGVLRTHDRTKFDIHYFQLPRARPKSLPESIRVLGDTVHDLNGLDDTSMLNVVRAVELDVAIDLNGFTQFHRVGLFGAGIAPVQVNYLGFPGSMGADAHDYVIGDAQLLPPELWEHFTEKVVLMPRSFFPVDRQRPIAAQVPTRQQAGLPETGFVFGCFATPDRIQPKTFTSWMNILKAVDGSVLWLKISHPLAQENILREVLRRGVAVERIVFAARTESNADHLARLSLMDLCLDTLPYNAHMTALDALFAGVPVVTLQGKAFAGRVASSLLNACNLDDLVCDTRKDYETRAIELAKNPAQYSFVKDRLQKARESSALFDTELYTHALERAYLTMVETKTKGLPPRHFSVE